LNCAQRFSQLQINNNDKEKKCNSAWWGLGRMGANMERRLIKDGHSCVVYECSAGAVKIW
jgi:hypothetical protein